MAPLLDSLPLVSTLRDALLLSAAIEEIEQLTPTMRRVRFAGPRLRGLTWTPGQHVRLQVAGLLDSVLRLHPHDALRTYSIYDADPDTGTLDIVMHQHAFDRDAEHLARRHCVNVEAVLERLFQRGNIGDLGEQAELDL